MVTIPCVKGLSEAFSRILKTYRICTAVTPHTMLRSMLVHPKDKISDEEKLQVVYKMPCLCWRNRKTTGSKSERTSQSGQHHRNLYLSRKVEGS